jgi:hypothetical protein
MNTDLVTGSRNGTPHVRSDQGRSILARTIGTGNYILTGCAATMASANTFHIADGYVMVQGAVVQVTGGDMTIANGTQGQKRNDLVCLSYSLANNVEAAPLAVVQGTPSTSPTNPVDPTVTGSILNGDTTAQIPLWRVCLDGITPTIGQLAQNLYPLHGDSAVGNAIFASDWAISDFSLVKTGNIVHMHLDATYKEQTTLSDSVAIFTIPAGFRPAKIMAYPAAWAAVNVDSAFLKVEASGDVRVLAPTSQQRIACTAEWSV